MATPFTMIPMISYDSDALLFQHGITKNVYGKPLNFSSLLARSPQLFELFPTNKYA